MKKNYLFTSESVSEGHPDKVCDSISDTLLDLFLTHDPQARSAVETMATTDRVIICGEARLPETVDKRMMEDAIRKCIKDIGYEQKGFDWQTVEIQNYLHKQSSDIARGVDETENKEEGAGDQGIIFGYATNELAGTEYSPATLHLSHGILKELARLRHSGEVKWLRPDAKSQVTLIYENGIPVGVDSVVVSTQHTEDVPYDEIRETVRGVVNGLLPNGWTVDDKKFYVNPTGRFCHGRSRRRHGIDGAQNHRRHLRRRGGARRRRFFGQRPDESRPFRGVCDALSGEKRRCGGIGGQSDDSGCLRHRCRKAFGGVSGNVRHVQSGRGKAGKTVARSHGFKSARHSHSSEAEPSDLSADVALRSFRTHARCRRGFPVGKDGLGGHSAP